MAHHPDRPVSISDEEALRVVRRWVTTKSQPEWIDQEARRVYEERQSVQPEGDRIAADLKKVESQAAKALDLYLKIDDTDGATATRVLATLNALEKRVKELKGLAASLSVDVAQPDWKALGVIAEGWDIFPAETHNAALRGAVGMLLITPKSAPRVRTWTVPPRVVPLWEMDEWSDWLSARRRRSA
jgi:hypothetical protein